MGGQCPGAPEINGPPRERGKNIMKNRKEKNEKKMKRKKRKERTKLFKYPDRGPHPIRPISP